MSKQSMRLNKWLRAEQKHNQRVALGLIDGSYRNDALLALIDYTWRMLQWCRNGEMG